MSNAVIISGICNLTRLSPDDTVARRCDVRGGGDSLACAVDDRVESAADGGDGSVDRTAVSADVIGDRRACSRRKVVGYNETAIVVGNDEKTDDVIPYDVITDEVIARDVKTDGVITNDVIPCDVTASDAAVDDNVIKDVSNKVGDIGVSGSSKQKTWPPNHKERRRLVKKRQRQFRRRSAAAAAKTAAKASLVNEAGSSVDEASDAESVLAREAAAAAADAAWRQREAAAAAAIIERRAALEAQQRQQRDLAETNRARYREWRADLAKRQTEERRRREAALKAAEDAPASPPDAASDDANFGDSANSRHSQLHLGGSADPEAPLCEFFTRTGACRFGARCSRRHPDSAGAGAADTLLIPNFFRPGEDGDYTEFFVDIADEFSRHGRIRQLVTCGNALPHLRGSVYCRFYSPADAARAFDACRGRWYAGRRIACRLVDLNNWRDAVCGRHRRARCPKGDADCCYLHPLVNPPAEAAKYLRLSTKRRTKSPRQKLSTKDRRIGDAGWSTSSSSPSPSPSPSPPRSSTATSRSRTRKRSHHHSRRVDLDAFSSSSSESSPSRRFRGRRSREGRRKSKK